MGAGFQFQYEDPNGTLAVAVNTGASGDTVDVLGTAFATTVQTGSGTNTVNLGSFGYDSTGKRITTLGASIPAESADVAAVSQAIATAIGASLSNNMIALASSPGTLAGFKVPIAVAGGTGTSTLVIDDSQDPDNVYPTLTPSNISGLNSPAASTIPFSGISQMALYAGSGESQTTVDGTFANGGPIVINTGGGTATVLVESSTVPLVLNGGGGTDIVTFDAGGVTAPITGATLGEYVSTGPSDPFAAEAGDAEPRASARSARSSSA